MRKIILMLLLSATTTVAELVKVEGPLSTLSFDSAQEYRLVELSDRTMGVNHLLPEGIAREKDWLWSVNLRTADGRNVVVTPAAASAVTHSAIKGGVCVVWHGVTNSALRSKFDFAVEVTLRQSGAFAWEYVLTGVADGAVWEVQFPNLNSVKGGEEEFLAAPIYFGRLTTNPIANRYRCNINYPQSGSMQFFAWWSTKERRQPELMERPSGATLESGWLADHSDAAGLLYQIEDAAGYHKQFQADAVSVPGRMGFSVTHVPELPSWPIEMGEQPKRIEVRSQFPVVTQPYQGGSLEAAQIYFNWARHQKWCSAGPNVGMAALPPSAPEALARWKPRWFREAGFWAKFYYDPYKVMQEWAWYQDWLRVPIASHYYRYNVAHFDDNYPEHLPGDSWLLGAMHSAAAMHVAPMPYINGVIWDTDTQSWLNEEGYRAAVIRENGEYPIWDIHKEYFAYMCPATEQWQAKMRETTWKLVAEHGMRGVYLDCLAATRSQPCYNAEHGHPLRGGHYQADGNRQLMHELRKHTRRFDPQAAFFTEGIGEMYLDCMDGFLALDYTRSSLQPGEQVYPLFHEVYHPWMLHFGSDAALGQAADGFALQMGRLFVWGSAPLLSAPLAKQPQPGERTAEVLREVVQAYYTTTRALTQSATVVRVTQRPPGSPVPVGALDVVAAPHTVNYDGWNKRARVWQGPAVVAGAFATDGRVVLLLYNITDQPQQAVVTATAALFGGKAIKRISRVWPENSAMSLAAQQTVELAANRACVVIFEEASGDKLPERLPLLARDWELKVLKQDGAFSAHSVADDALWSCDNGVLVKGAGSGAYTLMARTAVGSLTNLSGVVPLRTGARSDGMGLARNRDEQPFSMLRKLPFKCKTGGELTVVQGDSESFLVKVASDGREVPQFAVAGQGVFATSIFDAEGVGQSRGALHAKQTQMESWLAKAVESAASKSICVGFAALSDSTLAEAERLSAQCGVAFGRVKKGCLALRRAPTAKRLAELNSALREWFEEAGACPALFAQGRVGATIFRQVQTLNLAVVPAAALWLQPEHDWLAPGIPKFVAVAVREKVKDAAPLEYSVASGARVETLQLTPDGSGGGVELLLRDYDYVERLLPLAVWRGAEFEGQTLLVADLTWLEVNRPFELQTQPLALALVAGKSAEANFRLHNWSPLGLEIKSSVKLTTGWRSEIDAPLAAVAPLADRDVKVAVTAPTDAVNGTYLLEVICSWGSDPLAQVRGLIKLNLTEPLEPIGVSKVVRQERPARLRGANMVAFYARKGEAVAVSLENRQVAKQQVTLTCTLMDSSFSKIASRQIALGKTNMLEFVAKQTGAYYIESDAKGGSAVIQSATHVIAESVMAEHPLNLFTSPIERYFYVPTDATEFEFYATDGGPTETAEVIIKSPDGRVALKHNGNWKSEKNIVAVQPQEAGWVWSFVCNPRQDVRVWFAGAVSPWLSETPEGVLRGRR